MAELNHPVRVVVAVAHLGFGGAERQTLELLRQLRGTEWAPVRVICLSTSTSPHGESVRSLGYPLSIVRRTGGFDVARCLELRRILQQDEADVVHAVNWFASGYCVLATPRRARVISSIRNSHLPAGLVQRTILPQLIRRAAGVLVNSERGRQLVVGTCKVPPARVAVVPNGIDVDLWRNNRTPGLFRRELNIPAHAPLVAYVGRNARVKNVPRLLGVARTLLHERQDIQLVLMGEGLDPSLVAGTDLARVSRLHCVGPRRDVPALLHDATVLLLTSDSEGTPNVVLEALGSGLPVVATAVGDLAQILPPRCGMLVGHDTEQLAAAVLHVIANAADYRRAVEAYGPHLTARHSLQEMATRTVEFWRKAAPRSEPISHLIAQSLRRS